MLVDVWVLAAVCSLDLQLLRLGELEVLLEADI